MSNNLRTGGSAIVIGKVLGQHQRLHERAVQTGLIRHLCVCACCNTTIAPFESACLVKRTRNAESELVKEAHMPKYQAQHAQLILLPLPDAQTYVLNFFEAALGKRQQKKKPQPALAIA